MCDITVAAPLDYVTRCQVIYLCSVRVIVIVAAERETTLGEDPLKDTT